MKNRGLLNPFPESVRELFIFADKCWDCNRGLATGQGDAHHIFGRKAGKSPYNLAILCRNCHAESGKVHTKEKRLKYIQKTTAYLITQNYNPTSSDLEFMKRWYRGI